MFCQMFLQFAGVTSSKAAEHEEKKVALTKVCSFQILLLTLKQLSLLKK